MDAGDIWASEVISIPKRTVSKSTLYRTRITEAALRALRERNLPSGRIGRNHPCRALDDDVHRAADVSFAHDRLAAREAPLDRLLGERGTLVVVEGMEGRYVAEQGEPIQSADSF